MSVLREDGWAALARELVDAGALAPAWAPTFAAVPRAAFLPEVMWPFDVAARSSVAVSRRLDPAGWRRYAEADVPVVTQWDDGEHTGTEPGRASTSSASMPSVVAAMLDRLDAGPGHTVLEIGTGTGWNAALLAHRLGDANVTTVEVDPSVARAARAALERAGLRPTVVTGDGTEGHAPRAPYDRVIATCGVREVPYAWIEQTKPGGAVVAPWGTRFGNGDAVVRLTVRGGSGQGRFGRAVEFMKLRTQRTPPIRHTDHVPADGVTAADRTTTRLTAEDVLTGPYTTVPFAVGLRVRDCVQAPADKRGDTRPVWFYGLTDASWAVAVFRDGRSESAVHQGGPRRLWDEVEAAYRWWEERGRPEISRFGLTVGPHGQRAWLDHPDEGWPV